ncbi:hypothetical protein RJT34_16101 [Clitoria ternatea]|uniref:Ubiquitin-like protease family profile domain-containing protein n=1 Tax=Clitoria ternatea TaxID=43366 RepID=A0AAN9PC11_CLITE
MTSKGSQEPTHQNMYMTSEGNMEEGSQEPTQQRRKVRRITRKGSQESTHLNMYMTSEGNMGEGSQEPTHPRKKVCGMTRKGSQELTHQNTFMASEGNTEKGSQEPTHRRNKVRGMTGKGLQEPTHQLKKVRGMTRMPEVTIAREQGRKFKVNWNSRGEAIEPGKKRFKAYIGVVARQTVPISHDNWKFVPGHLKDEIWDEIQKCFEVDQGHKSYVLRTAGRILRNFRSTVRNKNVDEEGNLVSEPPKNIERLITVANHWDDFCNHSNTEQFKEESKSNRKSAKSMKNRYRRSQRGYAQLEQDLLQYTTTSATFVPRHTLWKEARVRKEGGLDESAQRVVDEFEAVAKTLSQEETQRVARDDILARVLGPQEHPGQVRCAGFGVTKRKVFGPSQSGPSKQDVQIQNLTQWMTHLTQLMAQYTGSQIVPPPWMCVPNETSSQDGHPSTSLQPDHRVSVPLCNNPRSGKGGFSPVDSSEMLEVSPPSTSKGKGDDTSKSLTSAGINDVECALEFEDFTGQKGVTGMHILKLYISNNQPNQELEIHMPVEHWGKEFTDRIGKENITEVIGHKWLSVSSLCLYIKYLCETYLFDHNKASRFSFISPFELRDANPHQHVCNMMIKQHGQDHLLLAPINVDQRWVLVAINTSDQRLYYFNPLRCRLKDEKSLKNMFNKAIINYQSHSGISGERVNKLASQWDTVQCSKQKNKIDSGYYIGLFIKEVLQYGQTKIPRDVKIFSFHESRILEFQKEWSAYLYHRFLFNSIM